MRSRTDVTHYRTSDGEMLEAHRVMYYEVRNIVESEEEHRMLAAKVSFHLMPVEGWNSHEDLPHDFYPKVQEKLLDSIRRFVKTQTKAKLLGEDGDEKNFVGVMYRLSEVDE